MRGGVRCYHLTHRPKACKIESIGNQAGYACRVRWISRGLGTGSNATRDIN
ncbi:MAG: hypothetical protein LWX07_11695 [Bacteroidetes bacterium]|nr:hypothetical protein [Bacteroidota bacterium]